MEVGVAPRIIIFIIALFIAPVLMAKTYVIQAEGMMCQACVETVTDGFQRIDETATVDVDLEKQTITVDMDSLSESQTKEILKPRGYKFISISN